MTHPTANDPLARWIADALGHTPDDLALFRRALTHGSHGDPDYERLEFLGDRVLGLTVADWLYERFPDEPEGKLSRRYNALVSGETCAEVAREVGVPARLRLGRQARDDGAADSDNVLGDAIEALIGALYLDGGLERARGFVRRAWEPLVGGQRAAPKHPKSALQEWAAAHDCPPPAYALAARHGPHHASRFRVTVEVGGRRGGAAEGEGSSKAEAETAAAKALLARLTP